MKIKGIQKFKKNIYNYKVLWYNFKENKNNVINITQLKKPGRKEKNMNQILATKTDNKKRKKPKMPGKSVSSDIAKVTKVFAIGLIIFGGCVIGTGSYSLYKEKETNNKTTINEMSKPVISVEAIEGDESTILLKTTSNIE